MVDLPEPVRLQKKGGGDYRLAADETGWHVSVWTKGEGRRRLREGTNLADGPMAMMETIIADNHTYYLQLRDAYLRLSKAPTQAPRRGFRTGWTDRAANATRNEYKSIVNSWYNSIAGTIKLMEVARWPLVIEELASYVEANIPQDLIE